MALLLLDARRGAQADFTSQQVGGTRGLPPLLDMILVGKGQFARCESESRADYAAGRILHSHCACLLIEVRSQVGRRNS